MKPRMRQLPSGNWCVTGLHGHKYIGATGCRAYFEWLKDQRYVARNPFGNPVIVDQVDISERRMARGTLAGD